MDLERCATAAATEYYAAPKKEAPPSETAWMDLERVIPGKMRQTLKDKHHMSPSFVECKTNKQRNKS